MSEPVNDLSDFRDKMQSTITIMKPMPSVRPRGTNTKRSQEPTRSIRFYQEHLSAIDEAAELCGMTRSSFVAWCSYYGALEIVRQFREYENRR